MPEFSVVTKNGFVYIADESGKKVASMLGTEEQKFANAYLFAAAGEMREALGNLCDNIEHAFPAMANLGPLIDARNAILKSQGGITSLKPGDRLSLPDGEAKVVSTHTAEGERS